MNSKALTSDWRRTAAWGAIALGVVLLAFGWFGLSGETIVAKQLPYFLSGGVGGLAAIGAGIGLLIAGDIRADRARLGALESQVLEVRDLLRQLVDERATDKRAG